MEIRYSKILISIWVALCVVNVILFLMTGAPQSLLAAVLTGIISLSVSLKPVAVIGNNTIIIKAMVGPFKKVIPYDRFEYNDGKLFAIQGESRKKIAISAFMRRKEDWDNFLKDYVKR